MKNTNLNILLETYPLQKINSATKYPSILTYHNLGDRGTLVDSLVENKSFENTDVYISEKIDGTNSRIVFTTNDVGDVEDFLIGSREDFLFAYKDRIINNTLGIVKTIYPIANTIMSFNFKPNMVYAFYGETFGGNINGAKQYTNHNAFSYRMFDVWNMPIDNFKEILNMDVEKIASWREHAGQPFVNVVELTNFGAIMKIPTVPYLKMINGNDIPKTLKEVFDWLQEFKNTNVILDDDYTGQGKAEGVVVRTADRHLIRKIRFEDYEKTKKRNIF